MTVVLAPSDDPRFQFVVACAIDRISAILGLRPDELTATPWFASRLEAELVAYGDVRVTVDGVGVVVQKS